MGLITGLKFSVQVFFGGFFLVLFEKIFIKLAKVLLLGFLTSSK